MEQRTDRIAAVDLQKNTNNTVIAQIRESTDKLEANGGGTFDIEMREWIAKPDWSIDRDHEDPALRADGITAVNLRKGTKNTVIAQGGCLYMVAKYMCSPLWVAVNINRKRAVNEHLVLSFCVPIPRSFYIGRDF